MSSDASSQSHSVPKKPANVPTPSTAAVTPVARGASASNASRPTPARQERAPQADPLPGTNVSPGVYHQELLRRVMPDEMVAPIIAFARKHPAVPNRRFRVLPDAADLSVASAAPKKS
jgi:hypothetical protein